MHLSDQFNPKQFTCDFYKQLLEILSTPELIENARTGFQEKGPDNRYSGKESYNLHLWNDNDAYDFSAAVAQALANTLLKYSDHNAKEPEELLISIQAATDSIKTTKLLKLTSNINVEAPLPEIKARLNSRINILQSKKQSLTDNHYTMYAIGGALLAGAVALTAIAFSK